MVQTNAYTVCMIEIYLILSFQFRTNYYFTFTKYGTKIFLIDNEVLYPVGTLFKCKLRAVVEIKTICIKNHEHELSRSYARFVVFTAVSYIPLKCG